MSDHVSPYAKFVVSDVSPIKNLNPEALTCAQTLLDEIRRGVVWSSQIMREASDAFADAARVACDIDARSAACNDFSENARALKQMAPQGYIFEIYHHEDAIKRWVSAYFADEKPFEKLQALVDVMMGYVRASQN